MKINEQNEPEKNDTHTHTEGNPYTQYAHNRVRVWVHGNNES